MSRLQVATRGLEDWKSRLADPELHWKRTRSAFEAAVSWELARHSKSGLPKDVERAFAGDPALASPVLLVGLVEHKVDIPHGKRPSQNDVWPLVRAQGGLLSMAVEATTRLWNDKARDELLTALLVTGFPYDLRDDLVSKLGVFNRFMGEARAIRRDGAAALDLSYVAAGRVDGFWEELLQPWDLMAGRLMVEEAGGVVTRFDGTSLGLRADEIVAANPALHRRMLAVLRQHREAAPALS